MDTTPMPKRLLPLLALSICGFAAVTQAHHNPASHYDITTDMVTLEGVVTRFRLINPHARIYFDVTTPDGEVHKWFAEGNAAGILKRRGWTRDLLEAGDAIRITGYPARDGSHALDWKRIELEDGTEIRGGNTVGAEKDMLYDDIDERRRQQQAESADQEEQ